MALFKPVIFLAFSNDATVQGEGFLESLSVEREALKDILVQNKNKYELVIEPHARAKDIMRVFADPDYRNRITVFHYAGHASGKGLHVPSENGLKNELASIEGLKDLFEKTQQNLDLVFLNGCSTQAQMDDIRAAGVGSVIGTARNIKDDMATAFAKHFYKQLVINEQKLQQAYDLAKTEVKLTAPASGIRDAGKRGPIYDGDNNIADNEGFPWLLETNNVEWILSRVPKVDTAVEVFMAYDTRDEEEKEELRKHLRLLQRQKVIDAFDSGGLKFGSDTNKQVKTKLDSADMVILLISSNFMDNDQCLEIMDDIIYEESVNDRKVIPVLVKKTLLENAPFALPEVRDENGIIVERAYNLLTLPGRHRGHKFVNEYADKDEAYTEIAKGIREGAIAYKKKHGIPIAVPRRRRPRR